MQNSVLMERQIVDKAIEALLTYFPVDVKWETASADKEIDGFLIIQNKRLPAEVKGDFRLYQLEKILRQKSEYGDIILIANILTDSIKEELKKNGVSYLDAAGNAYIFFPPDIAIAVEGKKRVVIKDNVKDRAFTKTGMCVVFEYLKDDALLQLPYRQIGQQLEVSLDTIAKTNESLKQQGFIRQVTKNKMALTDKKRLFEKWADVYETRIKPPLLYEKFSFVTPEAAFTWKILALSHNTCWGGEPAANILTDFIRPAIFTLYSTESKADLMRNYRLKPDPAGNIYVYLPFMNIQRMRNTTPGSLNVEERLVTHPLLTYADLLNSGDSRNFEVAQKLYESHVRFFL
jgi:hypothetical protein